MFSSILDDFDPRYWSRTAIAVVIADSLAVGGGVAWLLVELVSRIAWFLLHLLLTWLVPPGVVLAMLPPPPLHVQVASRYAGLAATETVVALDDLGDPDWDPTPDVVMSLDDVRAPGDALEEQPVELQLANLLDVSAVFGTLSLGNEEIYDTVESDEIAMIGMLGSLSDGGGGAFADLYNAGPGEALGAAEGGLIGSIGTLGVGGLGSRGGGSGEGMGGLGMIGGVEGGVQGGVVSGIVGRGGGGTGHGFGSIGTGRATADLDTPASMLTRAQLDLTGVDTPEDGARCAVRVQLAADGSVAGVKMMSCPEALQEPARQAALASTYTAATDADGSPVPGHVIVRYVVQP